MDDMSFNVGINVIETEGAAAPAIAGAPTSVTGLVLRSRRGATDRAVRVSNFRQFTDRFGAHAPGYLGAYAVEGFFQNGGREAWVARVVGAGAAAAQVTLKDRGGSDTVEVTAGSRGSTEPGSWGNDLYLGVRDNPEFSTRLAASLAGNTPARLQGGALTPPLDLSRATGAAADRQLVLDVDTPAQRFTVTFNQGTLPVPDRASVEDVADAINAVAGSRVVASPSASGILIVSRAKGAQSKVVAVDGIDNDTRTKLGFGTTNQATGADGTNPYTEAQVQSLSGFEASQWVRLDDGISQDWVKITSLESRDVGGGTIQLWVHFTAPPAAQRNEYRQEDGATFSTTEFDLVVSQQGTEPEPLPVETWEKLSLDAHHRGYAPNRINDQFSGSNYIVVADINATAFTGRDVPAGGGGIRVGVATPTTTGLTRVQGTDGADPGTREYHGALSRFDTVTVQLLAVPEDMPAGMLSAVTQAGVDYCAGPNKGDCMFVGHTPSGRDAAGAKAFGQGFRAAKVYGALYWPWITVIDPIGAGPNPTRTIPPTGQVLGVYTRIEQTRGVWKAPAGQEAVLRGALDVERDVTDIDHTDLVKNGSINGIRKIPGAGISVDASRTLSTDTRWLYVNVRLLFNFVKASLRDGLRWVKQEPNREDLWNMVKYGSVTPFLLRLHQQGAFGTGAPADVFTVICGPENNPPAEVMLGNLKVEIYFYPSRPAETIVIMVGQQESRTTAAER
jgi:Bacteriophage tail sheath protein